jgi:hypothetical protein
MANSDSSPQEQGRWRDRLKTAQLNYELAVAQSRRVLAEQTNQKQQTSESVDWSDAVRSAHREKLAALDELHASTEDL